MFHINFPGDIAGEELATFHVNYQKHPKTYCCTSEKPANSPIPKKGSSPFYHLFFSGSMLILEECTTCSPPKSDSLGATVERLSKVFASKLLKTMMP